MDEIIIKPDWQHAIESSERLAAERRLPHYFNIAQVYGLIPLDEQDIEDWTVDSLTALFTEEQQELLPEIAVDRHLANMHSVAGKALLMKLWEQYCTSMWVLMKPESIEADDWEFPDYAETSLDGTSVSGDYHRKMAYVCDRVFNYVENNPLGDKDGEVVNARYLIERFDMFELMKMSQFFSHKPTSQEISDMLFEALDSASVTDTIEQHIQKKVRVVLGTEDNILYVKELSKGGKEFHIVVGDPKLAKKLQKTLLRYGQLRLDAGENHESV